MGGQGRLSESRGTRGDERGREGTGVSWAQTLLSILA